MRDLANQNYSSPKISISKTTLRILLILAVVIIALFFIKSRTSSSSVGGSSIELKDAPKGLTPVSLSGVKTSSGGTNLTIENATFKNVSEQSGSATASRKYGDGSFSLSVDAKLPDPKGDKYQVWIMGGSQIKLAGTMDGSGGSWSLVFNDKDKNYSKMNEIWITREITSIDEKPEKHILEGSF